MKLGAHKPGQKMPGTCLLKSLTQLFTRLSFNTFTSTWAWFELDLLSARLISDHEPVFFFLGAEILA